MIYKIQLPLQKSDSKKLRSGDEVLLSGKIYTARDAAHARLVKRPAFKIRGQAIYHTGPTPARPGEIIGSCGPTTSTRMDAYTPALLEKGLKTIIGKGKVGPEVIRSLAKHKAVYFIAPGGCGALLSAAVKKARLVAYPDLGCEAIYELTIKDFPAIVAVDARGRSLYK